MNNIKDTLEERGNRYGEFEDNAALTIAIQDAFMLFPERWDYLPDPIKLGLQVIAGKIARAINGDPMYTDNYHDIAGYATLMETWAEKNG